ncbi:MAG: nucleotidyltransferase [Nitrospirae bacterium]|nr:nucleotidyltransferase [Nitrospirota bacterium]
MNRLTGGGTIKGYVLIGGLSVSVWGLPRGTRDVDLLVSLESTNKITAFCRALNAEGFTTELCKGGIADPVPYLIKARKKDVPIDMIIATKKLEEEAVLNAVMLDFKGVKISVISPEYLIVMKLKAGGPRDLLDVKELLQMKALDMESITNLAKRFRADKRLAKIKTS